MVVLEGGAISYERGALLGCANLLREAPPSKHCSLRSQHLARTGWSALTSALGLMTCVCTICNRISVFASRGPSKQALRTSQSAPGTHWTVSALFVCLLLSCHVHLVVHVPSGTGLLCTSSAMIDVSSSARRRKRSICGLQTHVG